MVALCVPFLLPPSSSPSTPLYESIASNDSRRPTKRRPRKSEECRQVILVKKCQEALVFWDHLSLTAVDHSRIYPRHRSYPQTPRKSRWVGPSKLDRFLPLKLPPMSVEFQVLAPIQHDLQLPGARQKERTSAFDILPARHAVSQSQASFGSPRSRDKVDSYKRGHYILTRAISTPRLLGFVPPPRSVYPTLISTYEARCASRGDCCAWLL